MVQAAPLSPTNMGISVVCNSTANLIQVMFYFLNIYIYTYLFYT